MQRDGVEPLTLTVTSGIGTGDADALQKRLNAHVSASRPHFYRMRSEFAPEFIQLIGSASTWLVAFGTLVTAPFFAAIAKRAGDDFYGKVLSWLTRPEAKPLADVSEALATAAKQTGGSVQVLVGLNVPDDQFGTALLIEDHRPERIAVDLACFVSVVEKLSAAMWAEVEAGRGPFGRATIILDGDDMVVNWIDQDFMPHEIRILP